MRRRLSGLWMVTNRPPCDEESRWAKPRLSRGRRANPTPTGCSPTRYILNSCNS
jgi:hypothetical protein